MLLIGACTSTQARLSQDGRKQLAAGDYDGAVFKAVEALQKKPDHEDAQHLLTESLAPAVQAHRTRISELGPASTPDKFDRLVAELSAIAKLRAAVQTLPDLHRKSGASPTYVVEDVALELTKARVGAADAHYRHAVQAAPSRDVTTRRMAAREFKLVQFFMPGYKDAALRYEQTRRASLTRLLLVSGGDRSSSGYSQMADAIVARVESGLSRDSAAMEFAQLIAHEGGAPGGDVNAVRLGRNAKANIVVILQLLNADYQAPPEEVTRQPRDAYVVVSTREVTDANGKKVKQQVKDSVHAVAIQHRIHRSASLAVGYRIIDVASGGQIKAETLNGTGNYDGGWTEFYGDKRALNFLERAMMNGTHGEPPSRELVINNAAQDAAGKFMLALKEYLAQ
jgi:hypothetical protein